MKTHNSLDVHADAREIEHTQPAKAVTDRRETRRIDPIETRDNLDRSDEAILKRGGRPSSSGCMSARFSSGLVPRKPLP